MQLASGVSARETRSERRARLRSKDAPRRAAVLKAAIAHLLKSIQRVDEEMRSLEKGLPHRPLCCIACAMGHSPRWKDLADKADRQDEELRRLRAKLKALGQLL